MSNQSELANANVNNTSSDVLVATAITEAVQASTTNIVAALTIEQQAALESKFNALPEEVRSSYAVKYASMSTVQMYIVRQMVREANGKLASNNRPKWYAQLELNAASLKSKEVAIASYAEKQLRELAESIDSKESTTLLKKYKTAHDTTSKDEHVKQLCGIFGVNPQTIA
jgi:hypothetical protein